MLMRQVRYIVLIGLLRPQWAGLDDQDNPRRVHNSGSLNPA
jgi:hypothetical protein